MHMHVHICKWNHIRTCIMHFCVYQDIRKYSVTNQRPVVRSIFGRHADSKSLVTRGQEAKSMDCMASILNTFCSFLYFSRIGFVSWSSLTLWKGPNDSVQRSGEWGVGRPVQWDRCPLWALTTKFHQAITKPPQTQWQICSFFGPLSK